MDIKYRANGKTHHVGRMWNSNWEMPRNSQKCDQVSQNCDRVSQKYDPVSQNLLKLYDRKVLGILIGDLVSQKCDHIFWKYDPVFWICDPGTGFPQKRQFFEKPDHILGKPGHIFGRPVVTGNFYILLTWWVLQILPYHLKSN